MPTAGTAHPVATTPSPARPAHGRAWRIGVLVASALAGALHLASRPPMAQPLDYMAFADGRTLLGVRNALNVLSNAAFAVAGLAGFAACRRGAAFADARERTPWRVFFAAVSLTSLGSAWFHLAPTVDTLVWDRLPMAVGFMALLVALVTERIDAGAGRRLLWPALLLGVGSVLSWYAGERMGAGDLRPYYFVQFYPLLALPLVLLLFPGTMTGGAAYLVALAAYAAAKVAELEDARIFGLGGVVSGHTLKHLLAAAGIGAVAWMLRHRHPAPVPESFIGPSRD